MSSPRHLFRRLYGDRFLHLVVLLSALALAAYAISVLGVRNLVTPGVWWQSIVVWFAVAVIGHDLILFPLYALADRVLRSRRPSPDSRHRTAPETARHVAVTNYLRLPTLATGLTLLLFLPGIIQQGGPAYTSATGLTQEPFLDRWLLLVAAFYLASALWYVVSSGLRHRLSRHSRS